MLSTSDLKDGKSAVFSDMYMSYRWRESFNPLNAELNPICYLLALLAHHFLHVSRIRVNTVRSPSDS